MTDDDPVELVLADGEDVHYLHQDGNFEHAGDGVVEDLPNVCALIFKFSLC